MSDTARQNEADIEQLSPLPEENQINEEALEINDDPQSQSDELPDGVSERTREQFEKLKESNKRLKAQLEANQQPKKTIVDDLFPQNKPAQQYHNLSPQQVQQATSNFVDAEGYLDAEALNSELVRLNKIAQEAQMAAVAARQEIERSQQDEEMRKAHTLYPQLDPESPEFNQDFYDMTKKHVVGQMYEQGRGSLLIAAQAVAKLMKVTESKVKAEQSRENNVQRREQLATDGSSAKRPSGNINLDELRRRSIAGDMDAISARLKASGY